VYSGQRRLDDFHLPNLVVSGKDVGMQECVEVIVFPSFDCVFSSLLRCESK